MGKSSLTLKEKIKLYNKACKKLKEIIPSSKICFQPMTKKKFEIIILVSQNGGATTFSPPP